MKNMMKKGLALTAAMAVGVMVASAPANAAGGKAMTWGTHDFDNYNPVSVPTFQAEWQAMTANDDDIVMVGCMGCNAYVGDTDINIANPAARKRILCVVPANIPEPAGWTALFSKFPQGNKAISDPMFYRAWSGLLVGLTDPVDAADLVQQNPSKALFDQQCRDDLNDPNARMAEWHDNGVGGHNMGARVHPNSKAKGFLRGSFSSVRYWVEVKNQPSNPWNP